jgi:hypothetical protein
MPTVNLGRVRMKWRGEWAGSTAYAKDDIVRHGVDTYVVTTAHTSHATTFSNDSANWELMARGSDIPAQSGNSGNFLQTDGTSLSWQSASAGLKSMQVFSSSGSHTWTKPAGINLIKVYVTGGGSGGMSGPDNDNPGSSGGAGGTAIKIIDVSSVSSVSVTVGAGGGGSTSSSNPGFSGAGGTSSFGSYCSAAGGGQARMGDDARYGGPGGTATGGDLNLQGGTGACGGQDGGSNPNPPGLRGADSFWGGAGGTGASSAPISTSFYDGRYGSGGGCKTQYGYGGNGGAGLVVVEEYA